MRLRGGGTLFRFKYRFIRLCLPLQLGGGTLGGVTLGVPPLRLCAAGTLLQLIGVKLLYLIGKNTVTIRLCLQLGELAASQ